MFVWLTFFGVDAEDGTAGLIHMITSQDAGGFVLKELLTVLVIIFLLAGLLLPLLLDFGLLEFIGAMLTRVIYLSEVGGLILGSKIPVNLLELFIIFLERTIISLLIAAPVAHLIFA